MNPRTVREEIAGPAGRIECAIDRPEAAPRGVAVVCHPHPQFGGTLDNKVVQMVARTFLQLGWTSVRFNFRGIGRSEGTWDEGRGEVEDALAVVAAMRARSEFAGLPWALAGFSFGGYVAATVADRLPEADKPRAAGAGRALDREAGGAEGAGRHRRAARRGRRCRAALGHARLGAAADSCR